MAGILLIELIQDPILLAAVEFLLLTHTLNLLLLPLAQLSPASVNALP